MSRRLAAPCAALLAAVLLLAACGSKPKPKPVKLPPSVVHACPDATHGKGAMGECAPATAQVKSTIVHAASVSGQGITWPDLSNNDPTYNMAAIRRHGHPAVVLKVNQGVGFLDGTFYYMAKAAQRAGLAVGGYDFDQEYTAAEAYAFVGRLHAAGITRYSARKVPPTLDIEFGVPSRSGVEHQLAVLVREYGRAQIYTGGWYWLPHFGCWWPRGVPAWLSGYPTASVFCGLSQSLFNQHQFTDHGFNGVFFSDMSRWLGSAASFASYTQAVAGPSKAQLRASLRLHRERRLALHRLIERHHCRPGQHATPRTYHTVCGRWLKHGGQEVAVIHRLERQLAA
jgi:predicted small lipoprotein YifL